MRVVLALALALAWVAYSGGSGERLLTLPPGRWDEAALCDWLSAFIGGGSDLDLPILIASRDSATGIAGLRDAGGGGFTRARDDSSASVSEPWKGGRPVLIRYRTQPRLNRSQR